MEIPVKNAAEYRNRRLLVRGIRIRINAPKSGSNIVMDRIGISFKFKTSTSYWNTALHAEKIETTTIIITPPYMTRA